MKIILLLDAADPGFSWAEGNIRTERNCTCGLYEGSMMQHYQKCMRRPNTFTLHCCVFKKITLTHIPTLNLEPGGFGLLLDPPPSPLSAPSSAAVKMCADLSGRTSLAEVSGTVTFPRECGRAGRRDSPCRPAISTRQVDEAAGEQGCRGRISAWE